MGVSDGSVIGITKIHDSGPPSARWNLVIVAEGYQASELGQFQLDAAAARDTLLASPPFDSPELACAINVYRLDVASDESGADKPKCEDEDGPDTAVSKDTYFDATFCFGGEIQRLLAGDSALVQDTVDDYLPEWHQILVIVNDLERGGAGGTVGWTSNSSSDWRDVFVHELGHSAFGLADEYEPADGDTYTGGEPGQPNVSTESDPSAVKWSALVTAGPADPTMPNADCTTDNDDASPVAAGIVGTFEGAKYWHCGLFRPVYLCKMRDSDGGDFCPVCAKEIVDIMAPFAVPAPGGDVTAAVTTVDFNDVPEGLSTVRAARFMVDACGPVTFQLIDAPGAPFTAESPTVLVANPAGPAPWPAYFWFRFTCDSIGAVPAQNATIRCLETGEDFVITLTANCVARPSVVAELVFDQSGSMLDHTDEGRTKEDVLKVAAGVFVDLLYDDNGIGINAYDHDPHEVMPIDVAGIVGGGQGRTEALDQIDQFAANPNGWTAIGDGVEQAKTKLDAASYDEKAMVVLTDGKETASKYIADVADGVIGQKAFAIGLGTAELIEPASLAALTAGTGGYLLMTGNLSADETFLLEKYYLQILAGVNNNEVVLDPEGLVRPGVIERIPFDVSASDVEVTGIVIARPAQVLKMALETPDGTVITEANASVDASRTARSLFIRAGLPLLADGNPAHEGRWHLLLVLDEKYRGRLSEATHYDPDVANQGFRGVRYSASVHAYSNLRMGADVLQNSYEPGATLKVQARLTEYGAPFLGGATVRAELVRPDGSTVDLALNPNGGEPGLFTRAVAADMTGVYRFRIIASGRTSDELPFTREQIRTGVIWHGGDTPDPRPGSDGGGVDWCDLIDCLFEHDVIDSKVLKKLAKAGLDIEGLRRCVGELCRDDPRRPRAPGAISVGSINATLDRLGRELSALKGN